MDINTATHDYETIIKKGINELMGKWVIYDHDVIKERYDIELRDGTIIKYCYPNSRNFLPMKDVFNTLGKKFYSKEDVVKVRMVPDNEITEVFHYSGQERIDAIYDDIYLEDVVITNSQPYLMAKEGLASIIGEWSLFPCAIFKDNYDIMLSDRTIVEDVYPNGGAFVKLKADLNCKHKSVIEEDEVLQVRLRNDNELARHARKADDRINKLLNMIIEKLEIEEDEC